MANNYVQTSVELRVEGEAIPWFQSLAEVVIDERDEVASDDHPLEGEGYPPALDDVRRAGGWQFWPPACIEVDAANREVFLYAEESIDSDGLVSILQAYLRRFEPQEAIGFEMCWYCDKPRPGEFGGSACLVTAESEEWMSTTSWLDSVLAARGKHDA